MIRTLLDLAKIRITAAVTLTTATGYVLGPRGGVDAGFVWAVLGTFVLAAGSACLNHVQDARLDGLMRRTRDRPIPGGKIRRTTALFVACLLILLGLSMLASVPENVYAVLLLGALAVLWYNGVYTLLKRATAFAVVPGALIGAIPPVIGFAAAGGHWADPRILLLAGFFFLWQIPHFWLLSLIYDEQYRLAGLPTLTDIFDPRQRLRLTFMWMLATAGAGMALSTRVLAPVELAGKVALVASSLWLGYRAVTLLTTGTASAPPFRKAFRHINAYVLLVILSLSLSVLLTDPAAASPGGPPLRTGAATTTDRP